MVQRLLCAAEDPLILTTNQHCQGPSGPVMVVCGIPWSSQAAHKAIGRADPNACTQGAWRGTHIGVHASGDQGVMGPGLGHGREVAAKRQQGVGDEHHALRNRCSVAVSQAMRHLVIHNQSNTIPLLD